jgi:putative CocE/NonD family hydrolase
LFVSSDCPDTDFTVKLTDVYPDGRSMLIIDGILRMRNQNGTDHWELMSPGTIYQVDVDLWSTSYIWNTGHQIRVDISSSNYPRCLNNPNTADGMHKNTTYAIAQNTIYIDSVHSSCLLLPEIPSNTTTNQTIWVPSFPKNILGQDHPQMHLPEKLQNILNRFWMYNQLLGYHSFMIK